MSLEPKAHCSVTDHQWRIAEWIEVGENIDLARWYCAEPGCECQVVKPASEPFPEDSAVLRQGCPFAPPEDVDVITEEGYRYEPPTDRSS